MKQPIRIIIVDDHPFFRQGVKFYLSSLPEFSLVGEAADGEQALQLLAKTAADVVLMDLKMTGIDGIATTTAALEAWPDLRILFSPVMVVKMLLPRPCRPVPPVTV